MRFNKFSIALLTVGAFVAVAAFSPLDSYGQTHKTRKKTTAKRKPVPAPTLPTSGDAEIVSQAGNEIIQGDSLFDTPQVLPPVGTASTPADPNAEKIKDLRARVKRLESPKPNEYDEKQKRLLLNLDILSRAEGRSEALRKQIFEMVEKETTIRTRLDQLEFDARPEMIQRSAVTFTGTMRPEEIREMCEKSIKAEQKNLQTLYDQIELAKANLEENLIKSDGLVEKLRFKIEKDIDDSLKDSEENP